MRFKNISFESYKDFDTGLRGRSYHDEIAKSARKPRKRGLKPWRGRVHLTRITQS